MTDKARRIVLMITHNDQGGAQQAILRLAETLRDRGHIVEVWFLYRKSSLYLDTTGARVLIDREKPGIVGYLSLIGRLWRALHREKPDATISFLPLANILGQTAATIAGIKTRVACHRNPVWTYNPVLRPVDRILGSLPVYRHVTGNSGSVKRSLSSYPARYREKVSVIPNGVRLEASPLSKAAVRRKFGLPAEAPILLNVGRLSKQKNQTFLLDVVVHLPNVHLVLVGGGELDDMLAAKAQQLKLSDRITFLCERGHSEVVELLNAADIFVLPSIFEGHCNAMLEAMSAGLPVVASDIAENVEALGEDEEMAGLVLPIDDAETWGRAIKRLLADEAWRRELAELGQRRAKVYTLDNMGARFEALLDY